MSLGDAIHISSALFVKEALEIDGLEFLTYDDGRTRTSETEAGAKSLSLLSLQDYTYGIGSNIDVKAVVSLTRVKPVLSQRYLAMD